MKGLKIRFPTRLSGQGLTALGASPIGMPATQIAESLAQGVLDGCALPWEVVPSLKVDELVDHHTEIPGTSTFYTATLLLVMNKARYESLPAELRQVLDANSGLPTAIMGGAAYDEWSATTLERVEERGNEIHTLSEEEAARWQQVTQPVIDAWAQAQPDGEALLEAARSLVAKNEQV
jgi:TRAP-type C4-dicarboxylate transport system substrate-binding protein